jgi:hypothetical protein
MLHMTLPVGITNMGSHYITLDIQTPNKMSMYATVKFKTIYIV